MGLENVIAIIAEIIGIGAGLVCIVGATAAGIRHIVAKRRHKAQLLLPAPFESPHEKVLIDLYKLREQNVPVCERTTIRLTPSKRAKMQATIKEANQFMTSLTYAERICCPKKMMSHTNGRLNPSRGSLCKKL